jgi:hypothetical protein
MSSATTESTRVYCAVEIRGCFYGYRSRVLTVNTIIFIVGELFIEHSHSRDGAADDNICLLYTRDFW